MAVADSLCVAGLGGGHDGDDGPPAKLLATINRAVPLKDNPNRAAVAQEKGRDGQAPEKSSAAGVGASGGTGKVRRTTQIVKRDNKQRNAILVRASLCSQADCMSLWLPALCGCWQPSAC